MPHPAWRTWLGSFVLLAFTPGALGQALGGLELVARQLGRGMGPRLGWRGWQIQGGGWGGGGFHGGGGRR